MSLPYPRYQGDARRELVTEFRGLDVTDGGGEGGGRATFSDMQNGSTAKYPFAASREARKVTVLAENACALHGGEVLCLVQPPYFYYGENEYDLELSEGEKQIVMMGTDLLIFPDGAYFDVLTKEHGNINGGSTIYTKKQTVVHKLTSLVFALDGKTYANTDELPCTYVDNVAGEEYTSLAGAALYDSGQMLVVVEGYEKLPESIKFASYPPQKLMLCFDGADWYYARDVKVSETAISKKEYRYAINQWERMELCEVVFSLNTDTINKSILVDGNTNVWSDTHYVKYAYSNGTVTVTMREGEHFSDYFKETTYGKEYNELFDTTLRTTVRFTWKTRTLPVFDYVVVNNNRIFGCRYGKPYDGDEQVNRLYASALGNYKAFEQFQGISTDSWYGDVGEEGAFTGACISPDGRPMFFKEDYAYVLYGDYPPYSYSRMDIRGVAEGAAKSLAYVDGALYWKSRHDIMRYTGSSLAPISMPLGDVSGVRVARAGAWKSRYYVMLDGVIYVYDAVRGLWSKEDAQDVQDFAEVRGRFYILASGGMLYALGDAAEEAMPWSLTSAPIGYALPNRKYVTQLRIRIELAEEATVDTVEISTDGDAFVEKNVNVHYTDADGKRTGTVLIPIRPRRCETFRYRLSGTGAYKLTGVTKVIEESGI